MRNLIWGISLIKYLGILGIVGLITHSEILRLFMMFWFLGILEILLTFPIFFQSIKQIIGMMYVYAKQEINLDKRRKIYKNEQSVQYRLPFEGEWVVVNGGITKEESHSWLITSQRFAYDFLILDNDGKSYSGPSKKLSSYYCYGKKILAPADGIVVETGTANKDSTIMGYGRADPTAKDLRGNYIVIQHTKEQYSVLAHLKPDSIVVRAGQVVKQGEHIALCGNSGNTTEPHLHFQIQDGKSFFLSMGKPIKFSNIEKKIMINYSRYDKRRLFNRSGVETSGYVSRGMCVRNV